MVSDTKYTIPNFLEINKRQLTIPPTLINPNFPQRKTAGIPFSSCIVYVRSFDVFVVVSSSSWVIVLPLNKRIRHGVSQNKVDRNVIVNLKLYDAGE